MQFPIRNLEQIRKRDPFLAEALDDICAGIATMALQTNANPSGSASAPPPISGLSVTAQGGIFDVAITDGQPVSRGIEYFVEYSPTAAFTQPTVIHLGATRNWRGTLGNQTLYFRAYSQYSTGGPSTPVYFGSIGNPTPVIGGGSMTGPALQPSSGSGTAATDGRQGGAGYGHTPFRGTMPPRT